VKESIADNQAFAEKFGINIELVGDETALVNVDHDRLLQVITNLLSNAIKFSRQQSTVVISITDNKSFIRVSITNKGQGIPKQFQANIFTKFSQVNTSPSRDTSGTGLGLSISKELIERMHGDIGFTSVENHETTFFFELPIAVKLSDKQRVFEKVSTILICQDDIDTTNNIKDFLEKNGFHVIAARTAQDAKEILVKNHVDAILFDLMLPNTDGISFIKELRAQYSADELPIIAISLLSEEGKLELNGNAFSIFDWIEKPVNPGRLVDDIKLIKQQIDAKTPTILFIEDEVDLIEVIANLLQSDANVIGATNISEAKRELANRKFDLVILDLLLPDGSGVDILPEISKSNTPIIVFSAYELPSKFTPYVIKALMKSKTSPHDFLQIIKNSLFNKKLGDTK